LFLFSFIGNVLAEEAEPKCVVSVWNMSDPVYKEDGTQDRWKNLIIYRLKWIDHPHRGRGIEMTPFGPYDHSQPFEIAVGELPAGGEVDLQPKPIGHYVLIWEEYGNSENRQEIKFEITPDLISYIIAVTIQSFEN
jgi:hypothetical protein